MPDKLLILRNVMMYKYTITNHLDWYKYTSSKGKPIVQLYMVIN